MSDLTLAAPRRSPSTVWRGVATLGGFALLLVFPFVAGPFYIDIANQAMLAGIGALSLMVLTGFAGQISLGHAGLIAAGAFTVGILFFEFAAPFWVTIPAAAVVGGLIGLIFGLPSLRLRGLYLAISTLALHFIVIYFGGEYEAERSYSAGILVDPISLFGVELYGGRPWFFVFLPLLAATYWLCRNLTRGRTGRAFNMIRTKEAVAIATGIDVPRTKLVAFVFSSALTAVAGALFAYYRGFVSVEAFSLYLAVQYVAMIIIGGIGSLAGAILGAVFVTAFPYAIETALFTLPGANRYAALAFAANYAAFGLVMILFLALEPAGLVGILRRIGRHASGGRPPKEARP